MLLEGRTALKLSVNRPEDIRKTAEIIANGGIVGYPFKGPYGVFGDSRYRKAYEGIMEAKNRPPDQTLVVVTLPEHYDEIADFSKTNITHQQLQNLLKEIHALGTILPADYTGVPYWLLKPSMTIRNPRLMTVLPIWAEYGPLRTLLYNLRELGCKSLIGTSANKNGQPTHVNYEEFYADFKHNLDVIVEEASGVEYPPHRRKSTSIVDLTDEYPRMHRVGNVSPEELKELMARHNFKPLVHIEEEVIQVKVRPEIPDKTRV